MEQQQTKEIFDVYAILENKISEINIEKESSEIKQTSFLEIFFKRIFILVNAKKSDVIIFIGYVFSLYMLFFLGSSIVWGVYYLDEKMLPNIHFALIAGVIIPALTWLYSTCNDSWSFKNRKMFGITLAVVDFGLVFATLVLRGIFSLFLPIFFKIPISQDITIGMVVNLARLFIALMIIFFIFVMLKALLKQMYQEETVRTIIYYKLNRNWDLRKNKKFCYDMKIVRRLDNGKWHRVLEHDRFLHCNSTGTSGTGKTSTCLTVSINNDFDQRIKNEDYQKRKLSKWLKKGKIFMTRDFDDSDFSAFYFDSNYKKYKKKIKIIQKKAMPVGITAMAPNEKFSDELYELAKAKHIKVNRIDPILVNGKHKEGFIGFNPLYISPAIEGIERKLEIFNKARSFADVNQAIFEKDESGEVYFTGLNRNLTTSITVMVLLTYPSLHNGKQPTPAVVQDIINDFNKAKIYRDQLVRMYSTKFNFPEEKKEPIMEPGKANVGEYQFILDVIDNDILGPGAKAMVDQARGLRNIINETLSNPLIREILCAENTIDLDKALENGEVTFINYAITLGAAGTAFGLFFLLSFINAVLRRPAQKLLLPHFWYIDELPELLHADLGRTFALFRQYRVGMFVALQSLDQLDKSPKTKYLKTVLIGGCAHQIVFGRCSTAEMKLYQDFGGFTDKVVETQGVSETALSMENTSMSTTRRQTIQKVNRIEGTDLRYRDFREVTMFTVTKGTPEIPFYGKTFFLEDIKKVEKIRFVFNWSKYFKSMEGFKDDVISKVSDIASKESSTEIYEYERNIEDKNEANTKTVIEAQKQASTVMDTHTKSVWDKNSSSKEIYLSSGRNTNEEVKLEYETAEKNDTNNKESLFSDLEEDAFFIMEVD